MQGEVEKAFKMMWGGEEDEEEEGKNPAENPQAAGRAPSLEKSHSAAVMHSFEKALSFKWLHLSGSVSHGAEAGKEAEHKSKKEEGQEGGAASATPDTAPKEKPHSFLKMMHLG